MSDRSQEVEYWFLWILVAVALSVAFSCSHKVMPYRHLTFKDSLCELTLPEWRFRQLWSQHEKKICLAGKIPRTMWIQIFFINAWPPRFSGAATPKPQLQLRANCCAVKRAKDGVECMLFWHGQSKGWWLQLQRSAKTWRASTLACDSGEKCQFDIVAIETHSNLSRSTTSSETLSMGTSFIKLHSCVLWKGE